MIVSTTIATSLQSVDMKTSANLNMMFNFAKAVPTIDDTLPADGWDFEKAVLGNAFGAYSGYAIGARKNGENTCLSAVGVPTNGGDIYVTDKYVAIIYRQTTYFNIIKKASNVHYEVGSFSSILPNAVAYTPGAQLCGVPPKAYSYLNGVLYEEFSGVNQLIAYPKFDKGIIESGRLKAAFGIRTGTWNMDVAPTSAQGLRKCLLNKWRGLPSGKEYGSDDGIFITDRGKVTAMVQALQAGASLSAYDALIQRYKAPLSDVYGNAGSCYFGVVPTPSIVERHKDEIAYAGVGLLGGKIEPALSALIPCNSMEDVLTAFTEFDGVFVDSGMLQALLTEYESKYAQLKVQQAKMMIQDLFRTKSELNKALDEFANQNLNAGTYLSDDRFATLVFKAGSGVRTEIDSSIESIDQAGYVGEQLMADAKYWAYPLSLASEETQAAELERNPLEEGETADRRLYVDGVGLKSAMDDEFHERARTVQRVVNAFNEVLKDPEEVRVLDVTKKKSWDVSHMCHSDESREFGTLAPVDVTFQSDGDYNAFVKYSGLYVSGPDTLKYGARNAAMKANTGIRSVSLRSVKGKESFVFVIDTYYYGGIMRDYSPTASFWKAAAEIVEICAKSALGEIGATETITVKPISYINEVLTEKGEKVMINQLTGATPVYADKGRHKKHVHTWNCNYMHLVGNDSYYRDAYTACPVIRYEVTIESLISRTIPLQDNPSTAIIEQADAIYKRGIQAGLSYCSEKAMEWLFVALNDAGLLDEVKLFGKVGANYITKETLAACTDCTLNNANDLIALLTRIRDAKDFSETYEGSALIAQGHGGAYTNLTNLINDLKSFAKASQDKVWVYSGKAPVAVATDWDLAGWYIKA